MKMPTPKSRKDLEIVTPENIVLRLELPFHTERLFAFILDVLLLTLLTFVAIFTVKMLLETLGSYSDFFFMAAVTLITFLMWNGYFIYFELKSGTTPGKKRYRLRVISQDGSLLPSSAIYVRNLIREVEVWLPLRIIFGIIIVPEGLSLLWISMVGLLPLFDKYSRRLGDMLAGTVVVQHKRAILEKDLVQAYQTRQAYQTPKTIPLEQAPKSNASEEFTENMLNIYGKTELQVLEDILRRGPQMLSEERAILYHTVVVKILRKIGYKKEVLRHEEEMFLSRFYEAQRKYLENKLVHGRSLQRRTRKWIRSKLGRNPEAPE